MKKKLGNFKIKKENKKPVLSNSEIIYLIKFSSYVTRFFYFHFLNSSYEKLAMTSQFELTRFYGVIICNSVFVTRKFQIPKYLRDYVQQISLYNWKDHHDLTLFMMGGGGAGGSPPYQFFPCKFYKRKA